MPKQKKITPKKWWQRLTKKEKARKVDQSKRNSLIGLGVIGFSMICATGINLIFPGIKRLWNANQGLELVGPDNTVEIRPGLVVTFNEPFIQQLGATGVNNVVTATHAFDAVTPIPHDTISIVGEEFPDAITFDSDGGSTSVLEVADSGTLSFDPRHYASDPGGVYHSCVHGLFHAIAPAEPQLFGRGYTIELDNAYITGTEGLSFTIETKEGESTKFTSIEEGAAEVHSELVDPSYIPSNSPYYRAISVFTQYLYEEHIQNSQFSLGDLQKSKTGALDFVRLVTGQANIYDNDIIEVMSWYSTLREKAESGIVNQQDLVELVMRVNDYRHLRSLQS